VATVIGRMGTARGCALWWIVGSLATVACGEPTGNGGGEGPRFEFVTGTPPADTINALPQPTVLVVLLDGDGDPMAGQRVIFETPGDEFHGIPQLFIQNLEGRDHAPITDTSDADGRTGVLVYRGAAAGVAWLRVRAPALALSDSLPFEILPGQPVELRFTPADTALHVASSFSLQGRVHDRYGNLRPEAVTFVAESASVSVSGGPGTVTVTGLAIGRASVRATGAGLTTRSWVSVVPQGTLGFFLTTFSSDEVIGIATAGTDGSGYDTLTTGTAGPVDWAPDGQSLIFHWGDNNNASRLYRVTLGGAVQRVISQDIGGYPEMYPRYGADGWVYFTAATDPGIGTDELWRVRPDGSQPHRIGLPAAPYESDTYPAPAPDGTHVWFSTDRPSPGVGPVTLAALHVDSGTVSYLGFYGIGAVWSPLGDRVAFIDRVGAVMVTAPDGSEQRVVSAGGRAYYPYLDWSPDGKWIVAAGWDGLDLIEPDLGLTLPLPFAGRWRHPSWRP
jgi:hypothetical protein